MPHHSLKDFSKAGVCAINPRGPNKRDIELRPVGIFTSISHADPASPVVFMYEVFISEIFPIYTVPTSAIRIGEISTCEGQEMLLVASCKRQPHLSCNISSGSTKKQSITAI